MKKKKTPKPDNVIICKPMMLLPPAKDKCQECAERHDPEDPHNASSMFYMVKFKMDNNREATWADAISHCSDDVKKYWTEELTKLGIDINSHKTRIYR